MMKKVLTLLLLEVILFSGCIGQEGAGPSERDKAISACKEECNSRLDRGEDLSDGPCVLDPIPDNPDWVCDVAHDPRQPVDNLPENQCSEYGVTANHFVEVTPECEFIKAL